ncbi:hypothetical protein [Rhizobium sp. RM]|uniref:hypothetical protein n=1 Tax=Rhizobium sp. RM TaxID=2748079 RepID=UPI00110D5467|nr:hypothetical protein [Rhizobium sp. RM]NWJ25379.1 hypothetical protein [Rhizobium sp. RM]TMV17537.1 hypothetical protein BJG94_16330 [Rhizobium sp. Td3]
MKEVLKIVREHTLKELIAKHYGCLKLGGEIASRWKIVAEDGTILTPEDHDELDRALSAESEARQYLMDYQPKDEAELFEKGFYMSAFLLAQPTLEIEQLAKQRT